jgi:hypothetical protein
MFHVSWPILCERGGVWCRCFIVGGPVGYWCRWLPTRIFQHRRSFARLRLSRRLVAPGVMLRWPARYTPRHWHCCAWWVVVACLPLHLLRYHLQLDCYPLVQAVVVRIRPPILDLHALFPYALLTPNVRALVIVPYALLCLRLYLHWCAFSTRPLPHALGVHRRLSTGDASPSRYHHCPVPKSRLLQCVCLP